MNVKLNLSQLFPESRRKPAASICASLGALFLAACPLQVSAQNEAATLPEGYITWSMPATGASGASAYFSVPMWNRAEYAGKVMAAGSNTIQVEGAPWVAGSFAGSGKPHFALIRSGSQAGRHLLILSNSANVLTVSITDNTAYTVDLTSSGFSVAAGDSFEVIPGDTLATLFGDGTPNNPVSLVGGTNPYTADGVGIFDYVSATWKGFYFHTGAGEWRAQSGSTTRQNDLLLFPEAAVCIGRKTNRPAWTLQILGRAPSVKLNTKMLGGVGQSARYIGTRYPKELTLSQLNFSGWQRGSSGYTADTLGLWNGGTLKWDAYYQLPNGQWRRSGDSVTDRSSQLIPTGAAITIYKRSSLSGAATFIGADLPYSLAN